LTASRSIRALTGRSFLSKETELGRESLYKALAKAGNPKLSTLAVILRAVGLKMTITVSGKKVS
jgi:probable addiction module antidote protein